MSLEDIKKIYFIKQNCEEIKIINAILPKTLYPIVSKILKIIVSDKIID
jgi:hypothetical protein